MGKSVFLKLFGDSSINKILDFLVIFNKFEYSIVDISEKAEVKYKTLKKLLPKLVKNKLIVVRENEMYGLNSEDEIVKKFRNFYWDVTNIIAGKKLGIGIEKQVEPQTIMQKV